MNLRRFLSIAGLCVLGTLAANADTVTEPGHFIVDLNDIIGQDGGGWGANTSFTDQVNTLNSSSNHLFTSTVCIDTDANHPDRDDPDCDRDPSIHINPGGGSIAFPNTFNSDAAGGGSFQYQDDGNAPITSILFITNFVTGQTYHCDSTIFAFCGFRVIHESQGPDQLEILFDQGTIQVATPEPAEYGFLLAAASAVVVYRRRRVR